MKYLVEKYCELPRVLRKPLWKLVHSLILKWDKEEAGVFLNYGYASGNGQFEKLSLEACDAPNKYGIQLYQYVTQSIPFNHADILEVGCGRGGGASWLTRYRHPKSYTGLDISEQLTAFCKQKHKIPALSFVKGEAEHLPFNDQQFDILINIESARCYGSIPAFFREAHRVLKSAGHFLFADMIKKNEINQIRSWLASAGFAIVEEEEITANVVHSLQADSPARLQLIHQYVPAFINKAFYEFAGVEGSNRFKSFYDGDIQYWRFVLKKDELSTVN